MPKRTKIVATIADNRYNPEFLKSLIDAGVNVFRLNTAHLQPENAKMMVETIREVNPKIAILIDTKGPEIRTVKQGEEIDVKTGDLIEVIGNSEGSTQPGKLYVSYPHICDNIEPGQHILIDDGDIDMTVQENRGDVLVCKILNDGKIKFKKGVNIPNVKINLPAISEKDYRYIRMAIDLKMDFIAHSFVQEASDIEEIKTILKESNSNIAVIAKIENQIGVKNLDSIIAVSDGVMVARGDLGVEIPEEKIPAIQRRIVKECINHKKPVIIATQMLHTMIDHPRPTRAEIADIATAVAEKADALMLSGETAMGNYPVEAVQTMTKVALEMEKEMEHLHFRKLLPETGSVLSLLAYSAVTACLNLPIKAVIADTISGRTVRYLAAYRGTIPLYAICYSEEVQRQLALVYGVQVFIIPSCTSKELFMRTIIEELLKNHLLEESDQVVVVGGSYGLNAGASFVEISQVRNLLQKDSAMNGNK